MNSYRYIQGSIGNGNSLHHRYTLRYLDMDFQHNHLCLSHTEGLWIQCPYNRTCNCLGRQCIWPNLNMARTTTNKNTVLQLAKWKFLEGLLLRFVEVHTSQSSMFISQSFPLRPGTQMQVNSLIPSTHVEPSLQGIGLHSSIFISQFLPTQNMHCPNSDIALFKL